MIDRANIEAENFTELRKAIEFLTKFSSFSLGVFTILIKPRHSGRYDLARDKFFKCVKTRVVL